MQFGGKLFTVRYKSGRIKKWDTIRGATIQKTEVKEGADREDVLHHF